MMHSNNDPRNENDLGENRRQPAGSRNPPIADIRLSQYSLPADIRLPERPNTESPQKNLGTSAKTRSVLGTLKSFYRADYQIAPYGKLWLERFLHYSPSQRVVDGLADLSLPGLAYGLIVEPFIFKSDALTIAINRAGMFTFMTVFGGAMIGARIRDTVFTHFKVTEKTPISVKTPLELLIFASYFTLAYSAYFHLTTLMKNVGIFALNKFQGGEIDYYSAPAIFLLSSTALITDCLLGAVYGRWNNLVRNFFGYRKAEEISREKMAD
jgi:hypothetical protein